MVAAVTRRRRQLLAAVVWLAASPALAAIHAERLGSDIPLPQIRKTDGSQLTLEALSGRTVLINFWASWCVACRTELPSLERLAAKRGDLVVIATSVDVERGAALKAFNGRYPHLRLAFASLESVERYGALGMPYSVILDKRGRVVARMPRAIEWDGSAGAILLRLQ